MKQLFFVKPPVAGSVKTRLARFTGPELANEIYKSILSEVLNFPSSECALYLSAQDPTGFFAERFPEHPRYLQNGIHLGIRMASAFQESFRRWPSHNILLTGSDIPGYHLGLARQADELLKGCDAVIIPSNDGGYSMIGFRAGILDAPSLDADGLAVDALDADASMHAPHHFPDHSESESQAHSISDPLSPSLSSSRRGEPAPGTPKPGTESSTESPSKQGAGQEVANKETAGRRISTADFFALFEGIEWSTPEVLQSQLANFGKLGLSVKLMEPLADLDDASDLYSFHSQGNLPRETKALIEKLPGIAVLIPVFNEVENLEFVLSPLKDSGLFKHIVCADNDSSDGSREKARALGALVSHCNRRGYGSTCLKGMEFLEGYQDWQVLLYMDGDGSDDPADLLSVLEPVVSGQFDLCIGARTGGALLPHQRFGNWLATFLIRWLYKHRYRDLGPFRAIHRSALKRLKMDDPDFGWTVQMQVRAVRQNLRIAEVDVNSRKRYAGKSKVSATVKGSALAGWIILRTVFREFLLNKKDSAD
ncbi:MAG: hypothetical protein CMN76_07215 [Spirochaetaceae bacterium]|nr:hypothetical protein [Spirochaetaceae bacterium]|tara:strand:+ start:96085 stop:97695 length:1611 start_codon:yes stop_codon:yes gene_type:complete